MEDLQESNKMFLVTCYRFQHFRRLLQNPTPKLVTSFPPPPEITHWTYTCLNPLALTTQNEVKCRICLFFYFYFSFLILAQHPRNWRKHLCVCLQLIEFFFKTYNFFYKRLFIGKFCLKRSVKIKKNKLSIPFSDKTS